MSKSAKVAFPLLAAVPVLLIVLLWLFQEPESRPGEISFTQFQAREDKLRAVTIRGDDVVGSDDSGRHFTTRVPSGSALATRLAQRGTEVTLAPAQASSGTGELINWILYYLCMVCLFYYLHRIARAIESQGDRKAAS